MVLRKTWQTFFGRFRIIFDIFASGILIFVLKRFTLLQREFLEARFPTFYCTFHFHFSERPAIISNVRSEFRTFGRNLERSARISNVQLESRLSGRNSERSAEIPNVGGPFLDVLLDLSLFPKFPVAHVLQF